MLQFRTVVILAALLVGGPPLVRAERQAATSERTMANLAAEYTADHADLRTAWYLPASTDYLDRRDRLDKQYLERLAEIDYDALDAIGQVEYHLLGTLIHRSVNETARDREELTELLPLLTFRTFIHALERRRWEATPLDGRAAAQQIDHLTAEVKQLHQRVARGKQAADKEPRGKSPGETESVADRTDSGEAIAVSPLVARSAAEMVNRLHGALKGWQAFYKGSQPDFGWWLDQPLEAANKQLDDYAKLLRETVAGLKGKDDDPLLGRPLGSHALARELQLQWIAYSAEELIALAQRELDWCETEMKRAADAMQLGDDWKQALARVKADFVPPGEQAELVAQIGREATQFVLDRQLITVPPLCQQAWRIRMMSPEEMKTIPYAAYSGSQAMVAYAAAPMSLDDKLMVMRGNNRHFTRLVVPHELVPGHHLERFVSRRHDGRVRLPTPFFVEGWALYWELRLWDLGWAQTPEDRIGMLFWRMHRAARIIVSLRYHLHQMSPEEMIDFLTERVGHERFGATSEVRRYLQYDPLYQAAYLVGGWQLQVLHGEAVGPERMTERAFHDRVLAIGSMPIELLRARLLRLPLPRDAEPTWRFRPN